MRKAFLIHPFLFALFPILSLFAANIKQVPFSQTLLPAAIVLSFAIFLLLAFRYIFQDYKKSALFVSVFLIIFFSFGHFYFLLARHFSIFKNGYLLSVMGILVLAAWGYLVKKIEHADNLTKILNIISISLVAMSLVNIAYFKLNNKFTLTNYNDTISYQPKLKEKTKLPNIYYIILDGHAREDILKIIYDHDNSPFIDYLEEKGFYVGDKSTANYCQSILSIPSSLNFEYLQKLLTEINPESSNWWPLLYLWRDNRVFSFLKGYGYKTIAFDAQGWCDYLTAKDVDILYNPLSVGTMNGFQSQLLYTTPISVILKQHNTQYTYLRKRILHTFDKLEEISVMEGPFFVFAHLLTPHQPFIFGEKGEPITPKTDYYTEWYAILNERDRTEYIESYKKQVSFIDKRTQQVIDKILNNSPVPPIIVLQSDHGPSAYLDPESADNTDHRERMSILNAYYFPDRDYTSLHKEITPVNSFRIIFNHFFGTDYELLEAKNYFSSWTRPCKFIEVTDSIR